ncbi:ABC transporter substrate-binding protein [Arthrobacter tecti]
MSIGTGGVFTATNNPFVPTSSSTANGWAWLIYEPLVQTNTAIPTQDPEPWLASSFEWAPDYTSVSFTAREGVAWSDGEPFSADDIAFTFNLIKENDALNSENIPYGDVAVDGDTVTVTFDETQFVNQTSVTGQFIVPEHIWESIDDPATYADSEPVGTGPFLFASASSSVARLDKNPEYWQADEVEVGSVVYQAFQGNDAIVTALAANDVDWAASFALNQESGFTDLDPETNLAWNVSSMGIDAFVLNTAKAPFDNVYLRRAINMVIDRQQASELATAGILEPITSVTGLPQPVANEFIDDQFEDQELSVDVEAAKAELEEGGFTLSDGVLTDPNGDPVTMELIDPSGWTDYLTELQVIGESLAEIGIDTSIETPSQDAWAAALSVGDFDGTMRYSDSGPTPYDIYASFMDGAQFAPIGETVTGNYTRYNNPEATQALDEYANAADEASREAALVKLQEIFAAEVPAVPMLAKASTGMFNTENWTGWPSEDDPYADPGILSTNISQVMVNLDPSS